jgi:septum formation inhibitor-activating ATPase MinD
VQLTGERVMRVGAAVVLQERTPEGAREAARRLNYPFLGEIPLDPLIRSQSDDGKPVALDDSTTYGKAFREVAGALAAEVSKATYKVPADIQIE